MTETESLSFVLNGVRRRMAVPPNRVLADLLCEELHFTSVRVSCDQGVCGVCTVLVDGQPVAACSTLAFEVDGRSITTVEGLRGKDGGMHPVQEAFVETSAFQCGFCTPGLLLSAKALLEAHPNPDRTTIRAWLSANVCRCTGYQMIVEAVEAAAKRVAAQKARSPKDE